MSEVLRRVCIDGSTRSSLIARLIRAVTRELLAAALRPIYDGPERACRLCLADCASEHWPAPPHGPLDGEPVDLVTIGANPQIARYDPPPATFDEWLAHGSSKAVDALAYFWSLFGSKRGDDYGWWSGRRIVNTRAWKWPGIEGRYSSETHGMCARTCSDAHLAAELRALRPAVILTYNDDAAAAVRSAYPGTKERALAGTRPFVVRGVADPTVDGPGLILLSGFKARSGPEREAIRGLARGWIEDRRG